jgi:hypothetical protein
MKAQDCRLGYLLVSSPATNVYIGGLMVVDGRGLPVEFRYTEPIQPTRIQQILYGSVLSRYIKTEVILETLMKSLESSPHLLVVNDDSFLSRELSGREFDVVRLTETRSGPLKTPGKIEKLSATEFLLQLTAESSPIRVQLPGPESGSKPGGPKSLPDKSKEAEVNIEESKVYSVLFEAGQRIDILEPLSRVEKALAVLCQEAGIKVAAT